MDLASSLCWRSGGVATVRRRRNRLTPTIVESAARLEERALLSVAMAFSPRPALLQVMEARAESSPHNLRAASFLISTRSEIPGQMGRVMAPRASLLNAGARSYPIFLSAPMQNVTVTMPTSSSRTTMPSNGFTNPGITVSGTTPIIGINPMSQGTTLRSGLFNPGMALPSGLINSGIALRPNSFDIGTTLRTRLTDIGAALRTRLIDIGIAIRTHFLDIGIAARDRLFG